MSAAVFAPKSALVCLSASPAHELCVDFCGQVVTGAGDLPSIAGACPVFLAGDVSVSLAAVLAHVGREAVYIVQTHATDWPADWGAFVHLGQLPRTVPGIGVYYPSFFGGGGDAPCRDFFHEVCEHHAVASTLTESNKPSTVSYRKGVYITRVTPLGEGAAQFRLLRCSTNFSNPSENCRPVDDDIIGAVNSLARANYDGAAEMNHVLAQLYTNTTVEGKDKKARIPDHSDKTKDFSVGAIMAFVTFYVFDPAVKVRTDGDGHDVLYHDTSVLTSLVWKEKGEERRRVSVTLHPGSVLLINADTNRRWTHEIRPSGLPVGLIPTRLGYVVRCSKTMAVHAADGRTYIVGEEDGESVEMRRPTPEDIAELKALYRRENSTAEVVAYASATHGKVVPYSMNAGDYMLPLV